MGQKILVVEDNELTLKLFCDLLRAHGYAAEPVRDGREAVARAHSFAPDLIVMDIQMPHISGMELIEQLKADPDLKRTPIMAVTAYAAKGDEERIRDAGAEGYVSKPISVVKFVEAVRALLEAAAAAPKREPDVAAPAGPEAVEVRAERSIAAAPEQAFDAWLDPATAGRWLFATPQGEMVRVAIEPWAGGRYEIVERREGEDIVHTGTYREVERPQRLAFTLAVPKFGDAEAEVSVEFESEDGGTRIAVAQEAPADLAERIRDGWAAILEGLAAQLGGGGDTAAARLI